MEIYIIPTIISIFVGLVVYVLKTAFDRLSRLEQGSFLDEHTARILIDDKISPVREDISELKIYILKILDSVYFRSLSK